MLNKKNNQLCQIKFCQYQNLINFNKLFLNIIYFMKENYTITNNTLNNMYFRSSMKTALSFLLIGTSIGFANAQSGRVSEDLSSIAKLSYSDQVNAMASKVTGHSIKPQSKSVALSGNYTIGTSGDYPTLTAAIADFNSAPITGPVTLTLLDATYPSETFPIIIQENSGSSATNTLTIKPAAGVDATISGNTAETLIKVNAADYVTIDGSNNGTDSDNLTLKNTITTGSPIILWVASTTVAGADYATIKNVKFSGATPSATIAGLLVSGPTLGGAGTVPNNHLTVESNTFNKAQNAMFIIGSSTAQDDGAIIKNNTLGSADTAEMLGFRGIALQNAKNAIITGNQIDGVSTASTSTASGILVGGAVNNISVTANKINEIRNTNTIGYGSNGIYVNALTTSNNVLVANNFISNVYSYGYSSGGGIADNGYGIVLGGVGTDVKVYHNSVSLNVNQNVAGRPAAINILTSATTAGAIDIRNNIFANNQTQTGEKYVLYSSAPKTVFAHIDYNDYFSSGANLGYIGAAPKATLADIKTSFGGNENSLNVSPIFTSTTDLHLTPENTALNNKGTALAEVTTDIDGVTRSTTAPDMGADEFKAALNGTYTVGSTGDYTSLTNTGGVFEDINAGLVSGNLTFNIIEDLTAETGANPLNTITGGYTVTIKPSGEARIISGTTNSNALIRTVGASNVTIDGSLSGGTDKSLSITNLSTTAPQVVRFGSVGTASMSNNSLKNTIITNGVNTSSAVVIADNGGTAGTFSNISITNNTIKKAYIGVYAFATVGAENGSITINDNDLSATGADAIGLAGLYAQGTDGAVIQNNTIGNFNPTPAYARRGIWLATGTVNSNVSGNTISNISAGSATNNGAIGILVSSGTTGAKLNTNNVIEANTISNISFAGTGVNAGIQIAGTSAAGTSGVTISKNKISNIKNTNTGGYAAVGIYFNGYSTAANGGVNVFNNFISDVANHGYNGNSYLDNGVGITFNGKSTGYKIYNNTINMNTDQVVTTGMTAAINVTSSISDAGAIDLRNNILVNSQTTTVNRYAIYSAAPATVFSNIDHNDYYSTGTNLGYLSSAKATLADWKTATGKDANSLNILPIFVSPTDLHLTTENNSLDNKGTPLAEVTVDIDDTTRSTTTPDMGAHEFAGSMLAQDINKNDLKLYPNPVIDLVNINYSSKIDAVEIFNLTGQKVSSKLWNASSGTMDMSNLAPGVYIITLKIGAETKSAKIIKK